MWGAGRRSPRGCSASCASAITWSRRCPDRATGSMRSYPRFAPPATPACSPSSTRGATTCPMRSRAIGNAPRRSQKSCGRRPRRRSVPEPPTVAVIVPVHNGAATIRTCLEALLAQDWPREALELIVVDNRSTDATQAVVEEYPVRLVEQNRVQSSYAARNRGVAASHGDLLAFTDADCVPDPGWVRALAAAFEDHRIGLAAGPIEAWRADRLVERYQAVRALRAERAVRHPVLPFAQT